MRRSAAVVAAAILAAAAIGPLTAGGATPDPPLVPPGFTVEATNGYSLTVFGAPEDEDDPSSAYMAVEGKGSVVYYFTRDADVTEGSLKADFGSVAHVDMSFEPTGEKRFQKTGCGDGPVAIDSGRYVGSFDFRGEEGYAEAASTSARGDIRFLLRIVCASPTTESIGAQFPGASLRAARGPDSPRADRNATTVGFQANKNRPTGVSLISASIEERRGPLSILRGVFGRYGTRAFRYGDSLKTASLRPPSPFSGTAGFRRVRNRPGSWTGSLEVDFPGRSDVALAGSGFRASIVHARITKRQIDRYD